MKKASKNLDCVKNMPELKHKSENEEFNIEKSEVVKWIISQPAVQQYIFNRVTNNGKNKLITYNKDKGTWVGVDYES